MLGLTQTPARRWTLQRVNRGALEYLDETWIWLHGDARHLAEGFSVPCFFSLLEEMKIDYALHVLLFGGRLRRSMICKPAKLQHLLVQSAWRCMRLMP